MKICEYENVKCPYCGENDKLVDEGKVALYAGCHAPPSVSQGPYHHIRCESCSGVFAIPCED